MRVVSATRLPSPMSSPLPPVCPCADWIGTLTRLRGPGHASQSAAGGGEGGAGDAVGGQAVREHAAAVGFGQAVAEGLDGVREAGRGEGEGGGGGEYAVPADRFLAQRHRLAVGGGVAEPVEEVLPARR